MPPHAPEAATRSLHGRVLCGYQGWFCAENDPSSCGWRFVLPALSFPPLFFSNLTTCYRHWFHAGELAPAFDLWPDTTELGEGELYSIPFQNDKGADAKVFSSCNPGTTVESSGVLGRRGAEMTIFATATVDRHFQWMQENSIDGVFLQRFISELSIPSLKRCRDTVSVLVGKSCEKYGRVFAIMYDVSGSRSETVCSEIMSDWSMLAKEFTSSSSYLHHHGKPVLGLWGELPRIV